MAFRTWGRLLLTALGVSVMAGAGQLGLAYGLGIVRLTGAFTGATVNQWPAQLVWVGWFAANATVAGAVLTERLARRDPGPSTTGRVLAVGAAAALGAFTVAPLCMQPARMVEIGSVDPVLAVGICAILGAVVGAGAAIAVLLNPPLGWNVAVTAGAVWLLALASTLPSLGATGALRTVRLGVLEPAGLDVDAAQRLSLFLLPIVALLAGAATAALARWRGAAPLVSGATGVAGPVLVAFAYLTAGPGDTIDRYQGTPYYGALVSIGAGVLGSAAAALLRWPVGTRTTGAHALPPNGGPRHLPAGRTPPTPGTSDAPGAGPAETRLTVSSTLGGPAEPNDPGEAPTATRPTVAQPAVGQPTATEPTVAQPTTIRPAVAEPSVVRPAVAEPAVAEPVVAVPVAAVGEPGPDEGAAVSGKSPVVGPQRDGQELALDADRTLPAGPDAAAPPAATAAAAGTADAAAATTIPAPAPATARARARDESTPEAEATGGGAIVRSTAAEPAEQPVDATPTQAQTADGPATEAQPVEARAADSQPTDEPSAGARAADEPSAGARAADEPSAAKSVAAAAKRAFRRSAGRSTEPQPVGQPAAEPAFPSAEPAFPTAEPASAGTESVETAGSAGRQAKSESDETGRAPKPRRIRKARSTTPGAATDRGDDSATQATEEEAAAATDQGRAAAAPEPSERIAAPAEQDVAGQLSAPRPAPDATGAAGMAEVGHAASGAAAVAGDAEAEATGRLRHDEPTTTPNPSDVETGVVDGGPTTGEEPATGASALPGGGDLAPTPTAQLPEQPATPEAPIDAGPPTPRDDQSQGAAVPPISLRSPDSADAASDPAPATGPAVERQDPPSSWPLWPTRRRAPVDAVEPPRPQLPEQTSDFAPRARHRAPLPDLNRAASWEGLADARSAGPVSTDAPEPAEAADPEPSGGDDAPVATSTGDEAVERPRTPEQATGRTRGRLGLFRRTRPQPEPESAAEEPVPAQDEEYVDWVAGLSRPLHDNEPEQESGRRSLRSSGRHHRS
ncbi:hypothetical protein ABZ814_31595 [Micromonospora musae]|uniref:hypothetical protein n=1 Tax=Micromonospora musae TaxID=1894970 RepID=UPI0033CBFFD5